MRTIVIGDIHGCYDEMMNLLFKKLLYRFDHDRVISIGDLIDKGPDSYKVVELACGWGWELVMGNHEEKALRYWKHEQKRKADPKYKNPMRLDDKRRALFDKLIVDGLMGYLSQGKPHIQLHQNWVAVHGGLVPGVPLDKQDLKQTCRLRYIHKETGKMLGLNDDLSQPPDSVFWTDRWGGGFNVIYGHTAARLDDVVETPGPHGHTYGIDTGCVYGGQLTAMVFNDSRFENFEIHRMHAKREYAPYYEQSSDP